MKDPDQLAQTEGPAPRRPYEPPAIEETSQFETLSLACFQNAQQCGDYYNPNPSQYDNS